MRVTIPIIAIILWTAWSLIAAAIEVPGWRGYEYAAAEMKPAYGDFETSQECSIHWGERLPGLLKDRSERGYLCGRGCVVKKTSKGFDFKCMEQSLNGEKATPGQGSFKDVFLAHFIPEKLIERLRHLRDQTKDETKNE